MTGEDPDDWAKEPCGCGHARFHHMRGPCDQQREMFADTSQLPPPEYADPVGSDPDDPFGWPVNWPPLEDCPRGLVPCCSGFHDEESGEP